MIWGTSRTRHSCPKWLKFFPLFRKFIPSQERDRAKYSYCRYTYSGAYMAIYTQCHISLEYHGSLLILNLFRNLTEDRYSFNDSVYHITYTYFSSVQYTAILHFKLPVLRENIYVFERYIIVMYLVIFNKCTMSFTNNFNTVIRTIHNLGIYIKSI